MKIYCYQQICGNNFNYETYLISGLTGDISVSSDGQIYVSYYGANGAAALGGFYSGFIFKPEITPDLLNDLPDKISCNPDGTYSIGKDCNAMKVERIFSNLSDEEYNDIMKSLNEKINLDVNFRI